jgi:hypothetical protein
LFKQQKDYFDVPSQDLTPRQIREKLAQLASNLLPSDALAEFKDLLTLKGEALNGGTGVTDDLKYNSMCLKLHPIPSFLYIPSFLAKFSRQNSIHVSPTVMWDGLIANEVSSGWEHQNWVDFFESKVAQ